MSRTLPHPIPAPMLTVACPPHVHCGRTLRGQMLETIVALAPAMVLAAMSFGLPAVRVLALAAASAVLTEWACWRMLGRDAEIDDFHGLLTGVLFAFLLPASAPWWLVALGSGITVVLGKMIYGGLGGTPLCAPALGWAVCRISWPAFMDTNLTMLSKDLPAPMADLLHFGPSAVAQLAPVDLLLGRQLGGLGAVQVGALLLGGLFLVARKRIRWQIPLAFFIGTAGAALVFQATGDTAGPLLHLLGGSTVFGAFFLATDPSSSPSGRLPMLLYGLLGGGMVVVVRGYGIYPEAVPFAILLANLAAPLLDKLGPKPFGWRPPAKDKGGR